MLRRLAVYALGEIGPQARAVVPALRVVLQDPVNWVRVWAASAFAKVTEDRSAVALLVAEMRAPQAFVRSLVAWHLGPVRGRLSWHRGGDRRAPAAP